MEERAVTLIRAGHVLRTYPRPRILKRNTAEHSYFRLNSEMEIAQRRGDTAEI